MWLARDGGGQISNDNKKCGLIHLSLLYSIGVRQMLVILAANSPRQEISSGTL
jgi:hypothetical protein